MAFYFEGPDSAPDRIDEAWNARQVHLNAGLWPTRQQMWEFNAAGMADTILQIVRRDAVYRGLGAECSRDDGVWETPARDRVARDAEKW